MIEFRLDRGSGVATYLQLVHQVKHALRLGVLRPGDRLPTAREVVEQLAINPNTVLKAYRELEQAGLVETHGRAGTLITPAAAGTPVAARKAAQRYADETKSLGLTPEAALALVKAVLGHPG